MANVYAGTDTRLHRDVAIKLLRPEMAARPDVRLRFEAEAQAAASLSHPNAVAVFDTGEDDGVPYIVMERLPGETLADRIAAGPMDEGTVRDIAVEVLGALGAAHASGLVHRDVKPGNILIAADGTAKIGDFGIAKSGSGGSAADLTGDGQLLGTPAYLAPERIAGAPASVRSDIYALGVVMYEAVTGVKPFDAGTPVGTANVITTGAHQRLTEARPGISLSFAAAVEQAMSTDPTERFASAADMAAAIAAPAAGAAGAAGVADPTVVPPADDTMLLAASAGAAVTGGDVLGARPIGPRPSRRLNAAARRRILAGALVGIVLLALLVGLLLSRGDGSVRSASSSTAAATTTPAAAPAPPPAPSPTAQLAQALRGLADHMSADDGAMAPALAQRLRQVADAVDSGGGGPQASALLAVLPVWSRSGLVSAATASSAIQLLRQVPGVDLTAYNAVANSPAPVPVPQPRAGKGKGKGDNGD
jgi:serine/threonine-protein kinase